VQRLIGSPEKQKPNQPALGYSLHFSFEGAGLIHYLASTSSGPHMNTPSQTTTFAHQAARLSWVCPIIVFILLALGGKAGARVIIDRIALLFIIVGLLFGIIALFGISRDGSAGILASAFVGIIMNGLLLFIFVTNFMAARARAQGHADIETSPAILTNDSKIPQPSTSQPEPEPSRKPLTLAYMPPAVDTNFKVIRYMPDPNPAQRRINPRGEPILKIVHTRPAPSQPSTPAPIPPAVTNQYAQMLPSAPNFSAPIPPAITNQYGSLALKGISGAKNRRMVLINNATLMVGETADVKVQDRNVVVCCKEIRDDSVFITADDQPMELKLGQH
jgi:hypothetical protein